MSFLRKLAPIATSALLAGMTIMSAAALDLATYPEPFVASGQADVGIVLGAAAATIDTIAAVDVATDLQANLAGVGGGSGGGVVTGEGINLATSNTKLYHGSKINSARTTLTDNELPTVLADGEVVDDSGNEFAYTQSIDVGSSAINFSTSGGSLSDPEMLVQIGTTKGSGIFSWKVAFSKDLNVSHADVQGNTLNIMGQDFTIGALSTGGAVGGTAGIVYLYGVGTALTLKEGEEKTVTVGGNEYTVRCDGVSSTTNGMITVNGVSKEINEGSIYKFGDLEVYAKNIFFLLKEAQVSQVELSLGSKRLKIENTKTVKYGSDDTVIKGTLGNVTTGGTAGTITGFEVDMSAQKSRTDHLSIGDSFIDPVFGTIKVTFKDTVPALDSTARDTIAFEAASRDVSIKFTDDLSGEEHTFTFAHDSDSDSDSAPTMRFAESNNDSIHSIEGENISLDEYFIINAGDYGRIIQVTDLPDSEISATDSIGLEDALSGESWTLTLGSGNADAAVANKTWNVDGQTYYLSVINGAHAPAEGNIQAGRLVVTWGSGANHYNLGTGFKSDSTGSVDFGDDLAMFPRIKLAKGEWISFMYYNGNTRHRNTWLNLTNGTKIKLPGEYAKLEDVSSITLPVNQTTGANVSLVSGAVWGTKVGAINWTFNFTETSSTDNSLRSYYVTGIDTTADGDIECNFRDYPAVLILEEFQADGTAYVDAICVESDATGSTSPIEMSVGQPVFIVYDESKASPSLVSLSSDTYKSEGVNRFGTWVQYDTYENDKVTITYPDEQMYCDVYIAEEAAAITGTSTGATGGALGSVTVMDSEVSSVQDKNLVVLGGSGVNSVAAKLLGVAYPTYGASSEWLSATGVKADMAIIKLFDSPYTDGKVAMLVAGYAGKDTRTAAKVLVAGTPALSGESIVLSTVTEATVEITEPAEGEAEAEAEAEPEVVCGDYTIETECTDAACFWYDDVCNTEEQVT